MKKGFLPALGIALALLAAPLAGQEPWPTRPVRFIVPSSPGGGTDLYARLLAQALGEFLQQQFAVENWPGASGNIGAEAAARAAPDGYTFLLSANPALTINPSLYKNCRTTPNAISRRWPGASSRPRSFVFTPPCRRRRWPT